MTDLDPLTLTSASSRAHLLAPTGHLLVFLPVPTPDLPHGDTWAFTVDTSATGTATIYDDAGNLVVGPLASGGAARILLARDEAAGTCRWVVFQ